jgi:hypothetical protein
MIDQYTVKVMVHSGVSRSFVQFRELADRSTPRTLACPEFIQGEGRNSSWPQKNSWIRSSRKEQYNFTSSPMKFGPVSAALKTPFALEHFAQARHCSWRRCLRRTPSGRFGNNRPLPGTGTTDPPGGNPGQRRTRGVEELYEKGGRQCCKLSPFAQKSCRLQAKFPNRSAKGKMV